MLSHLPSNITPKFQALWTTYCLGALLISGHAMAETNNMVRHEPISPIPLTVNYDKTQSSLGEILFRDKRLSKLNNISCASCHNLESGGDDNLALGFSSTEEHHEVNTPSIFNSRFNFSQNWDGAANTLNAQIELTVSNSHELNNDWPTIIQRITEDRNLRDRFNEVYRDGITKENIIAAIVEYEKSLITPNARFDRYLRKEEGSITDDELKGYLVFKEVGCISCHQGINIGGNLYQQFGVFYNYIAERGNINKKDYGRMNITKDQSDAYVFKVPSLRNIEVTAPYLHDGSAETLDEVISIMGKTQLGRELSDDEIDQIKLFLGTLTGEFNNTLLEESS